jgi:hypothetical protein
MRVVAVFLCAFLSASLALAQPCVPQKYNDPKTQPDYSCPSPGESALVPHISLRTSTELTKGKAAPWTGILMDPNRALVLGLRVKALRRLRWMDEISHQDKLANEVEFFKKTSEAERNLLTSQRDSYRDQTKELQRQLASERAWYRSWAFGVVVGVLTTTVAVVAAAAIAK